MIEHDGLADQFESHRARLRAVAYRMLGSTSEADDAVQESWLRLTRADTSGVENMGAWLTTVVARVCLDMLRSRKSRREDSLEGQSGAPYIGATGGVDPEQQALMADAVGLALLVVLDTLNPAERLAFVLHDLFDVPFDEIAPIVGRTPTAARQLASRARRRVQGQGQERERRDAPSAREEDDRRQAVVRAFLSASQNGDFATLLALLDPEVICRADASVVAVGAPAEVRGAEAVAQQFGGRARAARLALVNGAPGLVWATDGTARVVFALTLRQGRIVTIEMIGDPARLQQLDLAMLDDPQD